MNRLELFLESLRIMGLGMLGIFVVIGVIFLTIVLLNKVSSREKDVSAQSGPQ